MIKLHTRVAPCAFVGMAAETALALAPASMLTIAACSPSIKARRTSPCI